MENPLFNKLPKIGIRPAIDGRLGGVRESLETQTMNLAKSVAKLIGDDQAIPADVSAKILQFARAGLAVATMRGKSYLGMGGVSMGIAGSIVDQPFFECHLGPPECLECLWHRGPRRRGFPRVRQFRSPLQIAFRLERTLNNEFKSEWRARWFSFRE